MIDNKKTFEYKTEQDWYIGTLGEYEYVTSFLADDFHSRVQDFFTRFNITWSEKTPFYPQVHIVRYQSDFAFFTFLADMLNQGYGCQVEIQSHKGATLVLENGQLMDVILPKEGLPVQDFFEGTLPSSANFGDTILIATKNEGKTKEFRQFFEKLGYQVENLNAYPDLPDVAETGMTFEENARLKAETIANLTGKMVLADDSGLKVDALGGLPGVWSARFSGPEATDESNNAKLLHELAMVFEQKDRSAQFHCTLVIAAPNRDSLVVEADWDGYIGFDAKGEHGFGYDPLFLVGETGQTSAQLSLEEKNQQSHRAKALEKLVEAFPVWQRQTAQP